jgi:Disulfide bond isomerase protein N-terminus/Thioredoxin-like domain
MSLLRRVSLLLCLALFAGHAAWAQEALIRKNLSERLPNLPKIDEVNKTPIPGLYEVRIGQEILYADEQGNYLIQGNLIDTKTRADLTEARLSKLSAIDFASLPLKDAVVIKQGSGARRLAVFGDPNCGYCKRFERDLAKLQDVTIYTFLYPRPRFQRQVEGHLVRAGQCQGLACLDGRGRDTAQEHGRQVRHRRAGAQRRVRQEAPCARHAGRGLRGRHPRAWRDSAGAAGKEPG